jgi:hypothetical protein
MTTLALTLPALALGLILSGHVTSAQSQMTPIFKMTSSGTCPRYAWQQDPTQGREYNRLYTISCLPGQAPSGAAAIRFTAIPTAGLNDSTQPDDARWGYGSGGWIDAQPPPQGTIWYARWRVRLNGVQNWRVWDGGGSDGYKGFILGNNCQGTGSRIIALDFPSNFSDVGITLNKNIGPPTTSPRLIYPTNQWAHIQVKIQSSTTTTATNGRIFVYLNNNNQANPNASTVGAALVTSGWTRPGCADSNMTWGPGAWWPMATGGAQSLDWADFELDDQFDPNWFLAPAGTPTTPTAFNVIRTSSTVVPPVGALTAILYAWHKRRRR